MAELTPAEKWERIQRPQTVDDYAIGLTNDEASQIPELKPIVSALERRITETNAMILRAEKLASGARDTAHRVTYGVLRLSADEEEVE